VVMGLSSRGLVQVLDLDRPLLCRKILEAVTLPVIVRTWPTSCACIKSTACPESHQEIRQENCCLGGKKIKTRKRSRKVPDPESGASKDAKRRKLQKEADARIKEALQNKKRKGFPVFLDALCGGRQALGDKLSSDKGIKEVLGQHLVAFHARKEEDLRQKKAEEQREVRLPEAQ